MTPAMFIFGLLTILASLGVVFSRKTLYSALWLVVTFFLVGIHYGLLQAHFLANLQILVYAGAIMVLVVFVILLLGLDEKESGQLRFPAYISATLVGAFLAMLLLTIVPNIGSDAFLAPEAKGSGLSGTPQELGQALLSTYFLPFEMVSILLLGGIIEAVVLAYEPKRALMPGRGLKAKRAQYAVKEEAALDVGA